MKDILSATLVSSGAAYLLVFQVPLSIIVFSLTALVFLAMPLTDYTILE